MLKRILVALDRDHDSTVATAYAQEIGERFRAEITGLAVINSQAVNTAIGPGGAVGSMHYAEKMRAHRLKEERGLAYSLVEAFDEVLDKTSIKHVEHVSDGVPYKRIAEEMKYHDLLVIGRDPHFFFSRPDKRTNTLARIVKHGISPTLVVPDEYRAVERVLIAYDASEPAARTLQKFAQLHPFGIDVRVEIVHVRSWVGDHFARRSELNLTLAASYLQAHGFDTVYTTSLEMAEPQTRIIEYAGECGADMIVVGAHSVSTIHRIAFGSTTHALLTACPIPFFLYH